MAGTFRFATFVLVLCWAGVTACRSTVAMAGSQSLVVHAINYSRPESWLARPGITSHAGFVPAGRVYQDRQTEAHADVFYVHPTTGMRDDLDNVPIDDLHALLLGQTMLKAQASAFNDVARIYAPRYRQAALHVFNLSESALQGPMNVAYADIRRAFLYYMRHDNQGRPFFLAGHSQGSNHALRLLIEEVHGTPYEAGLVAAYLPGQPTPVSVFQTDLTRIAPCIEPEQVRCVATWSVFAQGYRDFGRWEDMNVYWDASLRQWRPATGMRLFNVNPVSWRSDGVETSRNRHLGALAFGVAATHLSQLVPQLLDVRTDYGYTFVSPTPLPKTLFYDDVFESGNYHVFDINLFWADLRANARTRLAAFLR